MTRVQIERFSQNNSAMAAIQFAMIAPALVLLFVGTIATIDTYRSAHQASYAAVTLSDLTTRVLEMNDAQRDAMFETGRALMSRWNSDDVFSVSITSVVFDPDANPDALPLEVAWSEATAPLEVIETRDLPDYNLPQLTAGESLILVEVKGTYQPTLSGLELPASYALERTSVRRPRFVNQVPYVTGS